MTALSIAPAMVTLWSAGAFAPSALAGAASARDATVLIRVIGDVRIEVERGWKHTIEKTDVEIGTGTGFLISPFGQVITNNHVVNGRDLTLVIDGQPFQVNLAVKRVDVLVTGAPGSGD